MSPQDVRIKKLVEAVLIRHHVNSQKADVDVIKQNVYLDGEFHYMGEIALDEETDEAGRLAYQTKAKQILNVIEKDIKKIDEIESVSFNFRNWIKAGGNWAHQNQ